MSNNNVKDWGEFQKLAELPSLEDLLFVGEPMPGAIQLLFYSAVLSLCLTGNPLEEKHSTDGDWREKALARLPKLKKLDGVPVVSQEGDEEG